MCVNASVSASVQRPWGTTVRLEASGLRPGSVHLANSVHLAKKLCSFNLNLLRHRALQKQALRRGLAGGCRIRSAWTQQAQTVQTRNIERAQSCCPLIDNPPLIDYPPPPSPSAARRLLGIKVFTHKHTHLQSRDARQPERGAASCQAHQRSS